MRSTLSSKFHFPTPSIIDYEQIFTNSNDVIDFVDNISNAFPDYINFKQAEQSSFCKKKPISDSNVQENEFKNLSELEKKMVTDITFIQNTKKHLFHPFFNFNSENPTDNPNSMTEIFNSNLSFYVKTDLVDGIVDSTIISTLLPFASSNLTNSIFLNQQLHRSNMTKTAKKIAESEKVKKLVQKRIFLLSLGQLRPTPEEVQANRRRQMRFPPASQIHLKSILKPPKTTTNESTTTSDSKTVHFIPNSHDTIPKNATIANADSHAQTKRLRQKEEEIRNHEKEIMTKIKLEYLSKQRVPKSKYFTTSPASSYNQTQSPKPKQKQKRSQSLQRTPRIGKIKLQTKVSHNGAAKSSLNSRKKTAYTLSDDPDFDDPVIRRRNNAKSNRPTSKSPTKKPKMISRKRPDC